MANQKPSPRQEKQSTRQTEPERKPRKRERRIHQRLQKAQQAHDKALERVKRAEARLQKRQARVQRIEEHLTLLRRQSGEISNSPSTGETFATAQSNQDDQEGIAQEETTPAPASPSPSSPSPAEATGFAKIARAVAESTERAARMAMARALEVANRLEQMGTGRHLEQELLQTQTEADKAHALAQKAERDAQEAERLASGIKEPQVPPVAAQAEEL